MGAGVGHSAFAAHIKVIVFWEPAERQLDVGGRQALRAEEAGSHRRRHRRCYTLRSPDRLRTMRLYGSMPHSTGTGSQGEPADPVGGRHLSGRKLIEARQPAAMRHIWAPAEQLRDVHLQNLTAPPPLPPILSHGCIKSGKVQDHRFTLAILNWVDGIFFLRTLHTTFSVYVCCAGRSNSVLRGTNQIPHTSLPAVITATKCKICSKVRNWKTRQECCVISHCIHSSAVPEAVKSLFAFGVDLIGIILYFPPYTLIYDICILYVSQ